MEILGVLIGIGFFLWLLGQDDEDSVTASSGEHSRPRDVRSRPSRVNQYGEIEEE